MKSDDPYQLVTLPAFDMLQPQGRQQARDYMHNIGPDLVVAQFPCTAWSQFQAISQRNPFHIRILRRRRREQLQLLAFVDELVRRQASRGRVVRVENPARSLAWDTAPMVAMRQHSQMCETITDMCCYNSVKPDTGRLVRKPTKLCGTRQVVETINRRCDGTHEHDALEGNMNVPDADGNWKTMSSISWAGAYAKEFAEAMWQGAALSFFKNNVR